eukprot:tig00021012_g17019.t1
MDIDSGGKRRKVETVVELHATCDAIRAALGRLMDAKKRIGDGTAEKPAAVSEDVKKLMLSISMMFVDLKQQNRDAQLAAEAAKLHNAERRKELDACNLQLQNLLYEKNHFMKEIQRCRDYRPREFESVEKVWISEAEFLADPAAESFRQGLQLPQRPSESDLARLPAEQRATAFADEREREHKLILARLAYELHQRKELEDKLKELRGRKKLMATSNQDRKKFFEGLKSQLKDVLKGTEPLQQYLGYNKTKQRKAHSTAMLLPAPLYVLFSQLTAYKEAFDQFVEVSISGSSRDAKEWAARAAEEEEASSAAGLAAAAAAAAAAASTAAAAAAPAEEGAVDDDDEGAGRRRSRKSDGAATVKEEDAMDADGGAAPAGGAAARARASSPVPQAAGPPPPATPGGLYKPHPLSVVLEIREDGKSRSKFPRPIALRFEYLPKLNVVTVATEKAKDEARPSSSAPGEGAASPAPGAAGGSSGLGALMPGAAAAALVGGGSSGGAVESAASLLANLFPDDTGEETPNPANHHTAGGAGRFKFAAGYPGRPFKWAQWAAGLSFLPEFPQGAWDGDAGAPAPPAADIVSPEHQRIRTVVQAIRSRLRGRSVLSGLLDFLGAPGSLNEMN